MENKNYRKLDRELDKISSKINVYAVNPINVDREKKRFLKNKKYNPKFRYAPYIDDLDTIKERLISLETDTSTLGLLFKEIINTLLMDIEMLKARGNQNFTHQAIMIWGVPDKKLLQTAKKILNRVKAKRRDDGKKIFIASKIKMTLNFALFKYGLREWQVKEKNMIASAAVKSADRELLIKKNEKFSKRFIERLIVHEIGTHIIRAENGLRQPYKIFSRGLPGYLMTEEGLAVVNEEIHGCLDPFTLKIYAGRILAVQRALKGSFRSTYNFLCKHFTKDTAWRLTVRAKRGLTDTSQIGGCTKDIVYLQGYLAIKKFLKHGGKIDDLYYGKIGLKDIEQVKKIEGIVDPSYLPTLRYFMFFIETFYEQLKNIIFLDLPFFDRYPLKLVQDVHPLRYLKDKLGIKL